MLVDKLIVKAKKIITDKEIIIQNIFKVELNTQFKDNIVFKNVLYVMQSQTYFGKLHSLDKELQSLSLENYIGKDVITCLLDKHYLIKLLATDLIFADCSNDERTCTIESNNIHDKYSKFGEFYENQFEIKRNDRVLIIGADVIIPRSLFKLSEHIRVTDIDNNRIGRKYDFKNKEIIIEDGHKSNNKYIEESDWIFVTGMTLTNKTADDIIEKALLNNAKLVFNLTSCSNLANELLNLGIHSVVTVGFPTLDMPGKTLIKILSKNSN